MQFILLWLLAKSLLRIPTIWWCYWPEVLRKLTILFGFNSLMVALLKCWYIPVSDIVIFLENNSEVRSLICPDASNRQSASLRGFPLGVVLLEVDVESDNITLHHGFHIANSIGAAIVVLRKERCKQYKNITFSLVNLKFNGVRIASKIIVDSRVNSHLPIFTLQLVDWFVHLFSNLVDLLILNHVGSRWCLVHRYCDKCA